MSGGKTDLKALREKRKDKVARARGILKEQNADIKRLKAEMAAGPKTVPAVAAAVKLPPWKVMWYLAALKKYGEVREGEKDGDYFTYELIEQ